MADQLTATPDAPQPSDTQVATAPASLPPSQPEQPARPPVVVKKYANRRLYNTETSSYITLENLAEMIRAGRDFVVYDAKSGDDITRGVLTQIIVEEESKGSSMLPTNFLRSLIGFYGDSLQGVVPNYLEQAMANFARQQQQVRQVVQQTFKPFIPASVEEMGRQNMAMIERAMTMFNPFHRPGEQAPNTSPGTPPGPQAGPQDAGQAEPEPASQGTANGPDLDTMRSEIESLRAQLAIAHAELVVGRANAAHPAAPAPNQAPNVMADPKPAAKPAQPLQAGSRAKKLPRQS